METLLLFCVCNILDNGKKSSGVFSCKDSPQTTFIVLFNTLHPEDARRRRPKHVGVVSKQRI